MLTVRCYSRLAPTPSGFLHLGNIISFIVTWLIVRKRGGRLLLRIDDLDAARKRPEYVQDIFDTLTWLQIDYDTGPRTPEEFEDGWSQRHRLSLYNATLERLIQSGAVFACNCSRSQLRATTNSTAYPGTCYHNHLPLTTPNTALRLYVPPETVVTFFDKRHGTVQIPINTTTGSPVVRQKNALPAYLLASVVDDEHFGINTIVRGDDLLPITAVQHFLAQIINLQQFSDTMFFHHPLLLDLSGTKLSKSEGALSIKSLRDQGVQPQEFYRRAASFLGITAQSIQTLDDVLERFDEKVSWH